MNAIGSRLKSRHTPGPGGGGAYIYGDTFGAEGLAESLSLFVQRHGVGLEAGIVEVIIGR